MHIMGLGAVSLFLLGLWLFCIYDAITTDESLCRHLPKMLWLVIVLFLPAIGSIMWLVAGRPWPERAIAAGPPSPFPEYDLPGRAVAADPAADEEFLRRCRERAEEQRRQARKRKELDDGSG